LTFLIAFFSAAYTILISQTDLRFLVIHISKSEAMPFSLAISPSKTPLKTNRWLHVFILVFVGVWGSTLAGTTDINNWLLENTLVFFFLGFLIFTFRKYQFSDLSYLLICIYLCLHVYGSK
jgi:putative membrane protein